MRTARRRLLVALPTLGALGLLGCGDSSAPTAVATYAQFVTQLARAECRHRSMCGFLASGFESACEARALQAGSYDAAAAVSAGRLAYSEPAAHQCLEAIAALDCRDAPFGDAQRVPACATVVSGTVAAGGACQSSAECATGAPCGAHDGCAGTCGREAAAGEDCSSAVCASGLYCRADVAPSGMVTGRHCAARGLTGEVCTGDPSECAAGLTCVADPDYLGGHCGAPGAQGSPCFAGSFVGRDNCAEGLICDANQRQATCQTLKAKGDSCGTLDACLPGLVCAGWDLVFGRQGLRVVPGLCQFPGAEGALCGDFLYVPGCQDMLACSSGKCTRQGLPGAACLVDPIDTCAVGFCDRTTLHCMAPAPIGAACDTKLGASLLQCAGDAVCDPTTATCLLSCG